MSLLRSARIVKRTKEFRLPQGVSNTKENKDAKAKARVGLDDQIAAFDDQLTKFLYKLDPKALALKRKYSGAVWFNLYKWIINVGGYAYVTRRNLWKRVQLSCFKDEPNWTAKKMQKVYDRVLLEFGRRNPFPLPENKPAAVGTVNPTVNVKVEDQSDEIGGNAAEPVQPTTADIPVNVENSMEPTTADSGGNAKISSKPTTSKKPSKAAWEIIRRTIESCTTLQCESCAAKSEAIDMVQLKVEPIEQPVAAAQVHSISTETQTSPERHAVATEQTDEGGMNYHWVQVPVAPTMVPEGMSVVNQVGVGIPVGMMAANVPPPYYNQYPVGPNGYMMGAAPMPQMYYPQPQAYPQAFPTAQFYQPQQQGYYYWGPQGDREE